MQAMQNGQIFLGTGQQSQNLRGDRTGGLVVQQAHGKYYEAVKGGRVFIGSNAITGVAIPIYSAKANALTLWNPEGSGYDLVLIATFIGWVSTTFVGGSLAYATVASPGGSGNVGTGLPFATLTAATPVNALVGSGYASIAVFSPAVNTTTANPSILRNLGINTLAAVGNETAPGYTMVDVVDGAIVLPPNSALQLVGTTAVAGTCNQAFVWEEVPR